MKRIYIAGPMTNMPALNFPAFHAEAARLRALGYEVANPAEINPDTTDSWNTCMRRNIPELVKCDGVVLLEGWERSRGASLEAHIAHSLGMRLVYPGEALEAA